MIATRQTERVKARALIEKMKQKQKLSVLLLCCAAVVCDDNGFFFHVFAQHFERKMKIEKKRRKENSESCTKDARSVCLTAGVHI